MKEINVKKCQKSLPLEAFIKINENTCHFKLVIHVIIKFLCNINKSNSEVELLTPEEMPKQLLFKKILEIDTNEYLENSLTSIDFNCNISIDMMVQRKYLRLSLIY